MEILNDFYLEILPNGVIQVLKQEILLRENGEKTILENWRTTLMPGQFEEAEKLLPSDKMAIVEATWSDTVVAKYLAQTVKH